MGADSLRVGNQSTRVRPTGPVMPAMSKPRLRPGSLSLSLSLYRRFSPAIGTNGTILAPSGAPDTRPIDGCLLLFVAKIVSLDGFEDEPS